MRIIGGEWRSRKLLRPKSDATRPMPDRVKEAVFNMLGAHYGCPARLPAIRVADVFAGSGSLGLEALSRGAESCCFFERNGEALAALRDNLDALKAGARATVIRRDAWSAAVLDPAGRPFELVFLDPPYRDSHDATASGAVRRYLGRLAQMCDPAPLAVFHHQATVTFELSEQEAFQVLERRTFGTNAITFLSCAQSGNESS